MNEGGQAPWGHSRSTARAGPGVPGTEVGPQGLAGKAASLSFQGQSWGAGVTLRNLHEGLLPSGAATRRPRPWAARRLRAHTARMEGASSGPGVPGFRAARVPGAFHLKAAGHMQSSRSHVGGRTPGWPGHPPSSQTLRLGSPKAELVWGQLSVLSFVCNPQKCGKQCSHLEMRSSCYLRRPWPSSAPDSGRVYTAGTLCLVSPELYQGQRRPSQYHTMSTPLGKRLRQRGGAVMCFLAYKTAR